jgi:hypothetical protein
MPTFYFNVRSNGRLAKDRRGQQYEDHGTACAYAIESMPQLLAGAVHSIAQLRTKPLEHGNAYVSTAVCDESRTVCVVRGSIVVEKR